MLPCAPTLPPVSFYYHIESIWIQNVILSFLLASAWTPPVLTLVQTHTGPQGALSWASGAWPLVSLRMIVYLYWVSALSLTAFVKLLFFIRTHWIFHQGHSMTHTYVSISIYIYVYTVTLINYNITCHNTKHGTWLKQDNIPLYT